MNLISYSTRSAVAVAVLMGALALAATPGQAQTVMVGGQPLSLTPGPIERSGRIFVPLRGIFERLGASVVYAAGTINATKGPTTVSLHIGSTQATVNGQPQLLDVAPFIVGATTYVPLRFVAQSLGANVGYDASTQVVSIDMRGLGPARPVRPPYPPPAPPPAGMLTLRAQQPAPDERLANRFVVITAAFSRRVDAGSVRVRLDGNDITSRSGVSATSFTYRPPAPLEFGGHIVRVTGGDTAGVRFDRQWSFTIVNNGPPAGLVQLRAQQPAPGSKVSNRFAKIAAEFTVAVNGNSVRVLLDGNDVTSRSGVSGTAFSYAPPAPLDFGSHTVRVTGRGLGGTAFDRGWEFSVVRSGPAQMHLTINQPGPNQAVGATFVVQGNTVPNARVEVTVGPAASPAGQFAANATAGSAGNFKVNVSISQMPGQQAITLKITATDPTTSQSTQQTLQLRLKQ
ncbi:MAG: stalk domain-containing protein [Candidatus Tumulicola sp.]